MRAMSKKSLLNIQNLNIAFGKTPVVNNVSFSIREGEVLCLVGESGSGKSLSALSAIGLLPEGANVQADAITFADHNLQALPNKEFCKLRGREIAMIFQEPMTSLNPVMTVGEQVAEVFEIHTKLSKKEIKEQVISLFQKVKIKDPERRYDDYPFQLSGGQRQRVMIAMALALEPKLLIADEPTTALDVTVQGEILKLIRDLTSEMGTAVLFITHDLGVVEEIGNHVCVMQNGEIVEEGSIEKVIQKPEHPYTKKLKAACPKLVKDKEYQKSGESDFLCVENLQKTFMVKEGGFFGAEKPFQALKGISFSMNKGETIGIVGESGCGKSTLSRCLVRLYDVDGGKIVFDGQDVTHVEGSELKNMRRNIQMVFQDPFASLNPRMKVGEIVAEGLQAHGLMSKKEREEFVKNLLQDCGLPADAMGRYPHQFSGGQRQRIGIARALALKPDLIIADEPVSALDVSVQKQILDLMADLKEKYNLSYLFISHDLRVISEVSDRVIVMNDGEIVEQGTVSEVFSAPKHAYTQKLLSAIPALD